MPVRLKPGVRSGELLCCAYRLALLLYSAWVLCGGVAAFGQIAGCTTAQDPASSSATESDTSSDDPSTTLFEHPSTTRYWLSAQTNWIGQVHEAFPADVPSL